MIELLYKDEVYTIIGAAIEVHRELGPGFLEAVYQEALDIEMASRQVPFNSQTLISIMYKRHHLQKGYIADFCCYEKILIEIKALDKLSSKEEAQLLNYLKATGFRVGLLINFGSKGKLEWRKFVR
jgi:GxxExxY protein